MQRSTFMLIIAGCLLVAGPALAGQVYRWVDHKGVTHYSDQPHADATVVPLNAPSPKGARQDTSAADAQPAPDAPPDHADAQAQVRSQQCTQARARLKKYQQADQIVTTGDNGKQRELTPDEKVATIVRTKKQVAAFCGEPSATDD